MAVNLLKDNDLIEVFRSGTHTDSSGRTLTYTNEDLDKIVTAYNDQPEAERHEAPIVIGHPKDNHPAWGWVKELQRKGDQLYARVHKLVPEFQEWVNRHMYEKRSISLYPNLRLKHIGFLGAVPPAVKGLENLAFQEGEEFFSIEFGEGTGGEPSARAARAAKFGISILPTVGHDRIPDHYSSLTEEGFADPVNLRFPITGDYMPSVLASWSRPEVQSQYTEKERQIISARIIKAASAYGYNLTPHKWAYSDQNTANIVVDKLLLKPGLLDAVKKQLKVQEFLEVPADMLNRSQLVKIVTGQVQTKLPVPVTKKFEDATMNDQQMSNFLNDLVTAASEKFGEEIATQLSAIATELLQKAKAAAGGGGEGGQAQEGGQQGTAMSEHPEFIALQKVVADQQEEINRQKLVNQLAADNAYFSEQLKDGQVRPVQRSNVFSALALGRAVTTTIDFAEGDKIVKKDGQTIIKELIASFEKQVSYSEQGGKHRMEDPKNSSEEFPNANDESIAIDTAARNYQEEQGKQGKTLTYMQALDHVTSKM